MHKFTALQQLVSLPLFCITILSGCGHEDSNSEENNVDSNLAPIAQISVNDTVIDTSYNADQGDTLILSSSQSSDTDGSIEEVLWSTGETSTEISVVMDSIGQSTYSLSITDNDNAVSEKQLIITTSAKNTELPIEPEVTCSKSSPYNGTAVSIPGKIEAENYDLGCNGVDFFDLDDENLGGQFRKDGVDIEITKDIGGGHNISYLEQGEWLNYAVTISETASYDLMIRAASNGDNDGAAVLQFSIDDQVIPESISINSTGGWQQWQTFTLAAISLTAGQQNFRIHVVNGGLNINYIDIQLAKMTEVPVKPGWNLVWNDEFTGPDIDKMKWQHEVNGQGGGNNELQYYTERSSNSYIENGNLVIKAQAEQYTGADGSKNYTSARLNSANKGDFLYGRMEIKAKMPAGQGLWPAIWMLPTAWVYGGWAASGEIDIMEAVNLEAAGANNIHGTLHYGGKWPNNTHSGKSYTPSDSVVDNFHTYAVEWEAEEIRWYFDDVHYQTQKQWWSSAADYPAPFNQDFHIILNVAVGGSWPGAPDLDTIFPQTMTVDYVRVYEKTTATQATNTQ